MRVLVTGGQGQLGSALGRALRQHEVLAPGHAELDVTSLDSTLAAVADFGAEVVIPAGR